MSDHPAALRHSTPPAPCRGPPRSAAPLPAPGQGMTCLGAPGASWGPILPRPAARFSGGLPNHLPNLPNLCPTYFQEVGHLPTHCGATDLSSLPNLPNLFSIERYLYRWVEGEKGIYRELVGQVRQVGHARPAWPQKNPVIDRVLRLPDLCPTSQSTGWAPPTWLGTHSRRRAPPRWTRCWS